MSQSELEKPTIELSSNKSSSIEEPTKLDNYENEFASSSIEEPGKIHTFLGMSGTHLNLAISSFGAVGFLLFGYDQGVMGSLLTLTSFTRQFPSISQNTRHSATLQGTVISIYEIGCCVTALSTVFLAEHFGRLKLMFIGCVIVIIGAVLQATAFTITHLAIARVVTGFGTGFLTATVPVWSAELSKAKSRGRLIMMEGSLITAGIAISYWIDFGFYFITKTSNDPHGIAWRIPIIIQVVFPIALICFVFKFPESPRWLMGKGRVREARIIFSAVYGLSEDHEKINDQLAEIQSALELERSESVGFNIVELCRQGPARNFHRLSLACWSQIFQQITGINLITVRTIFEKYVHMSPFTSRILAACNGTEYFLASIIGIFIIEHRWFGRRRLLVWGAFGQALVMMALTIAGWQAQVKIDRGESSTQAGIAAAFFLFAFNTVFGMSYLGCAWLYPPEISSLGLRAATAGLSTACNWIFNFMVVMVTPIMFGNIQYYTYCVFACINFLMGITAYIFYPETRGRTLEEIDFIFNQCPVNQPWKVVAIEKKTPYRDSHEDIEKPKMEHIDNIDKNSSMK
ncbi:unnamed protein product [Candida verbasci]|uniref:Major facilitator superfamily (MFS) profile domain-containing protein n=1 Tax=Candida verbasci TaxID=1227364 RepID=A0A9W4U1C0_9ASCO|nr:unnamed protein product [Candida verbasci]